MSNDVAVFEQQLMEKQDLWAPALHAGILPERFKAVAISAVAKSPSLLRVDRGSLITACAQAAQDGLLPDGRDGAITVFRDRASGAELAQWMPMVQGILKRCREKGELTSISAYVVYRQDEFDVILGTEVKVVHKPNLLSARPDSDIVLAYAIFRNGQEIVHIELMTRAEIEHTRSVSRAKNGSAWRDWYSEMCRKTVIRRGSKSVPLSSDLAQIIERDDQWVDFGLKDVSEVKSNPLNDRMIEAVAEEVDVSPRNGHAETPDDPDYEELAAALDGCGTLDELNQFTTVNKARLKALDAPLLGRIRARYRERQHDLRQS